MSKAAAKKEADTKALEILVDELMKDRPNNATVKKLSHQLGIPYSIDAMTQINTVLHTMSSTRLSKELEG